MFSQLAGRQGRYRITTEAGISEFLRKPRLAVAGSALLVMTLLLGCGQAVPTPFPQVESTPPPTATPGIPQAQTMATVSGTLGSVDVGRRIVVVVTESGGALVLSLAITGTLTANGAVTTLSSIGNRIGSRVAADYNPANNIAHRIEVSE